MKKLLLLFSISLIGLHPVSAQWGTVGNTGFSSGFAFWNNIAFDSENKPYVAYSDQGNAQRVTVKRLESGVWTTLGAAGFAGGQGDQALSMAISSDDIPYVAVISSVDLQASVWKLMSGTWQKVGADISEEMAGVVAIALNSADEPYLCYRDQKTINGIGGRATVKKFDGTAWVTVGIEGFSDGAIQSLDFEIDGNDVPYVAYEDGGNSLRGTVKKFDGISWVNVGTPGFTGIFAKFISLAINSANVPYFAFRDSGVGNKASCMKFNGTSWEFVGAQGISTTNTSYTSLAIDKDDVPFIAYRNEASPFSVSVKKFDGTAWSLVGVENFTGNSVGFISIAMDFYKNPFVAYQDGNFGSRQTVSAFIINDPLPVRLITFDGKFSDNSQDVILSWTTTEEFNNNRFEIQSGISSNTFKTIGEINGKGNSNDNAFYTFTDRNPAGTITYYRLKQIDHDGTFSYSKLISVHKPQKDGFYLVSNPVQGNVLRIQLGKSSGSSQVKLFSLGGKALGQWQFLQDDPLEIDVKGLASGAYILQYEDANGTQSRKFIRE
ncbi:T9SS type A sorting domain-containing protein [Dyadobacter arcticus]|uniref:Por secretion system C-terminal sorting domain-containing protein n=1 Tax=Dyadobacter arcticus TaxID=1078754 RepID=A0ABX0URE2_9BACT|nr:T9SS type A sorting domain-containing protein [Dyadobacter arcticus]NIJ55522.1 hypothetical protein [Dyadobacter arcticus]